MLIVLVLVLVLMVPAVRSNFEGGEGLESKWTPPLICPSRRKRVPGRTNEFQAVLADYSNGIPIQRGRSPILITYSAPLK